MPPLELGLKARHLSIWLAELSLGFRKQRPHLYYRFINSAECRLNNGFAFLSSEATRKNKSCSKRTKIRQIAINLTALFLFFDFLIGLSRNLVMRNPENIAIPHR
jgi:hypothetical protein